MSSEEGKILSESLVWILTGLNRDLERLLRATATMRPYFGENTKDGKFPHLLIHLFDYSSFYGKTGAGDPLLCVEV